ncbi:hypothetical protein K3172_09575 [Qipengyuania sp. 6B39]|uniref:hypothetical protein n=1 Tax=Qipengyuania proteolytica TaxID=2867239 RepID=UPI001C8A343A|nr:hypothetical protein [Qipengyuania proteolytica]MBX7496100.1 hypothetical protein [Qipengyuania proteolytica]
MKTFLGIVLILAGVGAALLTGLAYFVQLMAAHNGGDALKGIFGGIVIALLLGAAGIWLIRN